MLATIGYEGAKLEDFIGTLQAAGVQVIVDIRDRAQSRRPGFSKTALKERLERAGMAYVHFKELGDPKEGREAARSGEYSKFQRIYAQVLRSQSARDALDAIITLVGRQSICLLCYERDHRQCHRKMVADEIESVVGFKSRHLGVQGIEPTGEHAGRVRHLSESAAA